MTADEQKNFLTHTRLFLSRDIKRSALTNDVYLLKQMSTGAYIRVSADELYVLGCFVRGSTCAELLPHLILNRRCPVLDRLYELVLRARAAGMLLESREEAPAGNYSPSWWPSLDTDVVHAVWWTSFLAGVIAFFSWNRGDVISVDSRIDHLWIYPLSWAALSLAASFGSLLASAYVHRKGGEVRKPTFHWKTPLPRWTCDWSDCEMVGRETSVAVAKLRITPFLLMAFAFAILPYFGLQGAFEGMTVVVMAGLLWRIAPYPGGPAVQWIEALKREPLVSTARITLFYRAPNNFPARFFSELKSTDWRFSLWLVGYTVIWGAMLIWFFSAALVGSPSEVFRSMISGESADVLRVFGAGTGMLAAGGLVLIVIGWVRSRSEGVVYGKGQAVPSVLIGDDVAETFEDSPLLRELPEEIRADLIARSRRVTLEEGEWLVGSGETGEDLYVLEDGELDLVDRAHHGAVVARLRRGDVLGELPFFGNVFRPGNMRAVGRVRVVAISSPDLEIALRRYLNVNTIEEIVMKRTLLRRMPLAAGWSEASIGLFARFARFEDSEPDSLLVSAGRESRCFHLVVEGGLDVLERGRRQLRIGSGDFFGEIPLLSNSPSACDVVVVSRTRCLVVTKADFLALMGQDIELALQIERIASSRLGRPIFPYKAPTGEVVTH